MVIDSQIKQIVAVWKTLTKQQQQQSILLLLSNMKPEQIKQFSMMIN